VLDILSDLNEPQRLAVTHVDGPLLVLAGAGSGKTRVITRRVGYLLQQGIEPWNVLAITFTNKAAREMQQRVERLGLARGVTICTFHSLCARLLREFADEAGISRDYTIYDHSDQIRLVKDVMKRLDLPTANLSPSRVHASISNAKNELQTPDGYGRRADGFYSRNVAAIYRQYERALADNNALDFDDLLLRMASLLRDRADIRELLARRYRYVLIDEYQDTNRAQYVIAHGIALDHKNICVTGDPDQSIYAWRGADVNNILEFEADYPGAVVVRLEENYRSTKPILSAASRLIAHNRMRKEKALWTRRPGGADVRVICCDDETAEARQVARRIASYGDAGGDLRDIAVFYRVNSLSRVLEEALMERGIAYRVARGVEFYNRKEIKDVLAYLKLLVNPSDNANCLRIINTPARGIGAVTIKRLAALAESAGISLLEACRRAGQAGLGGAAVKKVAAFADIVGSLGEGLDRPVREIIEDVVQRSGLSDALDGREDAGRDALANIDELISVAAQFDDANGGAGLADYLLQVSLVSDVDHFEAADSTAAAKKPRGAVTLMTLHAAKGLEFPAVFIIGCEDGLLPFKRADESSLPGQDDRRGHDPEEERRLAFVGMTRARDELTLSCARYRMTRGRTTPQAASPFLDEIGPEQVAFEDLTTREAPGYVSGAGRGGFYADVHQRRAIEAMSWPDQARLDEQVPLPPEYEHLCVGCRVSHPKFGLGRVTRLRRRWPDTRAEVLFERYGRKTIVLSKTTLEPLTG